MQNFCYKCGQIVQDDTQLIENLCQKCYIQLHPLLKIPLPLQLRLCKKCTRYYIKNRWISSHFDDLENRLDHALKETIPQQLEIHPQTELEITTNILGNLESILRTNSISVDIKAKGNSHETLKPYTENYKANKVKLLFTICPSCLSLKRGEYQAVLHIIAPSRELIEHELDYTLSLIDSENIKSIKMDYLAYISKFTMKKGKLTFYIGSEKFARYLASKISYNLGGILKETYKFGARKIPKEVKKNKLSISLHLPSFVKGDLLWFKNSPLYITKVQGKKAIAINLNNYKKIKLPLKLLKNAKILQHISDLRLFLYFSHTKETIQVMDLQDYQIYEIPNSPQYDKLEVGKYIKGFEVNGQIFLILKSNKISD